MEQLKFKTNINCSGCVARVTNPLNQAVGEGNWNVDTNNPDKPLTVTNTNVSEEEVTALIRKAGFKAEKLKQ